MSLSRAAAVGAVVLACGRARAAEPEGRVHLSLPSCELPRLPSDEVRAAVAIELNTSGLSLLAEGERQNEGDVEASLYTTCSEDGVLELRATWGSRDGSRTLKLRELPAPARPRAVALALAELLTALRPEDAPAAIEVELTEDPAPPEAAPATAPEPRPALAARPKRVAAEARPELAPGSNDGGRDRRPTPSVAARTRQALTLQGELRSFSFEPAVFGVRAGYEFNCFVLGLGLLRSSTTSTEGTVSVAIAYGYFEWRIHEFGRADRPWFTFGPRLGLGTLSLAAAPAPTVSGANSTDVYAEVAQFAELWATLPPFRFGTQFEFGYAMGAIAYDSVSRVASYGGAFASALLEVTLLL